MQLFSALLSILHEAMRIQSIPANVAVKVNLVLFLPVIFVKFAHLTPRLDKAICFGWKYA